MQFMYIINTKVKGTGVQFIYVINTKVKGIVV